MYICTHYFFIMEDKREFDQLFLQYYEELYFFAMQILHDEEDSRDVVSDAFEEVWIHFASIEYKAARYYLYKNVRNKCIDLLRKKKTRQQYAALYHKVTSIYTDNLLEVKEREEYILYVLNSLPSPTKEIFVGCYLDRYKYAEVAQRMGISIDTVKKHIVKALKMIKEQRARKKRLMMR